MFRIPIAFAILVSLPHPQDPDLLKALARSKVTLREGIQQVGKGAETAISAKFELEEGKLSLSVYTAGKGVGIDAEHNVLQEYSGSPEGAAWKPGVEVFHDVEHVARSAQQLTLLALASVSLLEVLKRAEQEQAGTIYSITPVLRDRKPRFVVLVADQGRSREVVYDGFTGEAVKARDGEDHRK